MALAAATVLAACGGDDNGTGPGNGGNGGGAGFSATVAGDVETTVKGAALFGTDVDEAMGQVFGVEMMEEGDASLIQIIRLGADPGAGTYSIIDATTTEPASGDWVAVALSFDDNGGVAGSFVSTGGTIKITSKSGSGMKGTFSFDATGALTSDPTTPLSVTVTGTFSATPAGQFAVQSVKIGR
jgi:hypothetical protein